MTVWHRIGEIGETFGREKPRREKKIVGPIIYWHPDHQHFIVVPPNQCTRLKNAISKGLSFDEVINKSSYTVFLQPYGVPFNAADFYGILGKKGGVKMASFFCTDYGRRVSPSICLANKIRYPIPPSKKSMEDVPFIRERIRVEQDETVIKRLRKELRRITSDYDPFPLCRRCKMGKELASQTCLGVDFNPADAGCKECGYQNECCHLMRLRIEKLLEGRGEEVIKGLKKQYNRRLNSKEYAEVEFNGIMNNMEEQEMAKKKKPEVEVTPATPEKKKKPAPAPEPEPKKDKKKAKGDSGVGGKIKELLLELAEAKSNKDAQQASKIRGKLRNLGYKLSEMKK